MSSCVNDEPGKRLMGILQPNKAGEPSAYWTGYSCGAAPSCAMGFRPLGGPDSMRSDYSWTKVCTENSQKCVRAEDSYYDDTASLMRCCTDSSPVVEYDCKPGYCAGSSKCGDLMLKSCGAGEKFLDDKSCKSWCIAHPGKCDRAAAEYCDREPGDPFCACLKSPAATGGGGSLALPSCFDGKCIASGYKLQTMLNPNCPAVCQQAINCYQQTAGSCHIDQAMFDLHCGDKPSPVPPKPEPEPPKPDNKLLEFIRKYSVAIIVLMFVLLILVAIISARSSKKGEKTT